MGKFIIKRRTNGEYQFTLIAGNGQVILVSEGYTQMSNCLNGIEAVKKYAQDETKFDRRVTVNGKFYFNLKASNGEIIGSSQLYESEASRENGIWSVQRNSQTTDVVDN